jgi:hypothetical protein
MNVKYMQIYETSYTQVSAQLEELTRFFGVVRGFSLKCNTHLKVLTNLVNEMIDSDDALMLTDVELKASSVSTNITQRSARVDQRTENHGNRVESQRHNLTVNVNRGFEGNEQSMFARPSDEVLIRELQQTQKTFSEAQYQKNYQSDLMPAEESKLRLIVETFQAENQKLWELVRKNESGTHLIKTCFEQLVERMPSRQTNGDRESLGSNMQHEQSRVLCSHCSHDQRRRTSSPSNNIYDRFQDQPPLPNELDSRSVQQFRNSRSINKTRTALKSERKETNVLRQGNSTTFAHEDSRWAPPQETATSDQRLLRFEEIVRELKEQVRILNKENNGLKSKLEKRGSQSNGQTQEMLKQLLETKFQQEIIIKNKDSAITDLVKLLEAANQKISVLQNEVQQLGVAKRTLEETMHEHLKELSEQREHIMRMFSTEVREERIIKNVFLNSEVGFSKVESESQVIDFRRRIGELESQVQQSQKASQRNQMSERKVVELERQVDALTDINNDLLGRLEMHKSSDDAVYSQRVSTGNRREQTRMTSRSQQQSVHNSVIKRHRKNTEISADK